MRKHFSREKTCPPIYNDINLTNDIKDTIMRDRFYRITKESKLYSETKLDKSESNINVNGKNINDTSCSEYILGNKVLKKLVAQTTGHIYIVHLREFVNKDEPTYKVGYTKHSDTCK